MEDDREYDSSVLVEGQGVDIILEVASSYRPVKGMTLSSIDQAFDFYSEYAKKAGFGVRKGGSYLHDGVLKTKYFTCCKGHKPTKMYKMVFVPFTAIDNRCHSVTVGAGLLASETIESAPKVVFTDQDPAMKQATAIVFPNTRHRLFMWHIMKKVADKVEADLCNNEDFKSRLCNIVWTDSISPFEFEKKWQAIMVEFELDKNKWLTDMYEIRFDWIPAFYRDEPLSGLMQIHGRRCDHDSRYTYTQLETRSYLERKAVRMYTRSIFNDVQDEMNEIVGGVSQFSSCEEEGGFLRCKIMDFNAYAPGFFEVVFKKEGEFGEGSTATCSCKRFEPKIKEISREIKHVGEYLIISCVADIDELIKVRDVMNLMIEKANLTRYERVRPSKRDRFVAVLGFEQPSEVTVRVPTGIRNKDRGSHKRIKSKKEIAISRSGKSYRECQICHIPGHNSRTCKALQQQPQQ
ncbi:protein FAR1-RELATED SEQUENCE 5-like [Bidens hawaiensis]|uniref:protein FAR1-RELATED SEQUENCE 5-like n=1 Tax=Bidens hawaiensis TaxID=980011 RepID=UPI00404A9A17